jgi:hypothetical protein
VAEESASDRADRRRLALIVIVAGFVIVGILAVSVVGTILAIYILEENTEFSADQAVDNIHSLLAIVLPLMGAWVGAVIAFYFTRENLDASARNIGDLLGRFDNRRLQSIMARDAMVPLRQIDAISTTRDDGKSLDEAVQNLGAKGLGRLIVMNDAGTGRGVLHDADASNFVLAKIKAGSPISNIKISDILSDPEYKTKLDSSVIFCGENSTLAQIKDAMEEKAKSTGHRCRDAFVTAKGDQASLVVGYISDKDIAKHGAHR